MWPSKESRRTASSATLPTNLSPAERDRIFGPLEVVDVIGRDQAVLRNPPPLVEVPWGEGFVTVHELAAPSLFDVMSELEELGLLELAKPIAGFQPRLVRTAAGGNKQTLSAHAYGSAVDVRFDALPQGRHTDDLQRAIADVFERHGWFWGERFTEPDPHHFTFEGPGQPPTPLPPPPPREPGRPQLRQPSPGSGLVLTTLAVGILAALWRFLRPG